MTDRLDPRVMRRLRLFTAGAASFSVLLGLSILVGWNLPIAALSSWRAAVATSPSAAACFVLGGLSIWLCRKPKGPPFGTYRKMISTALAAVMCLITLLSLMERFWLPHLDIDRLLLGPQAAPGQHSMFPLTAVALLLLGIALLAVDWRTRQAFWPAQFLCLGPLLAAAFGLAGLNVGPKDSPMFLPPPTITGLFVLGAALLTSRPTRAICGLMARSSPGSRLLRRALGASLLILTAVDYSISKYFIAHTHLTWVEFSLLAVLSSFLLLSFGASRALAVDRLDAQQVHTRELRERLAAVVDSSNDAIISNNLQGTITGWNRGAHDVFGYSAVEAVGQPMLMLIPADRAKEESDILARIAQGESVKHFETVRVRKDGVKIDVSVTISPIRDIKGDVIGASKIARDITEHRRAEEALRESEYRFQTLANGIPQLAWMAEGDGFVFWYNQRWYDYTGATWEQMQTLGWDSTHDPGLLPRVRERWAVSIATGQPFEMEFPLHSADGDWCTFLTRIVPLKDAAGHVFRWFGTSTDISERKQAEQRVEAQAAELSRQAEKLRRSQDELQLQARMLASRSAQLEAANRELEAFSYSVSHDLNTPLRHIGGFAKILHQDFAAELPLEAQEHLQRIQGAVGRAGLMVGSLLNLARLGKQALRLELTALTVIVDQAIEFLQPEYEGRAVEWHIERLPVLQCDQVLMSQVFQNLLGNALKYTRGRSSTRVEVGSIEAPGKPPVIFVRDNGAGFDMKYAERLFGTFQRLHRASEFEGTGVGLATVRRIIQKHGGRVWAEAELDRGATFYFTVSASEPPVEAEAEPLSVEIS